MGQQKSKASKTSYDVAPVEKDFKYERSHKTKSATSAKTGSSEQLGNEPNPAIATAVTAAPPTVEAAAATAVAASQPPVDARIALIPTWVKEEYFIDVAKQQLPEYTKITSFKVQPAVTAGENYATFMLRVDIDVEVLDGTTRPLSYMLKVPHESKELNQLLDSMLQIFEKENAVYFDVIPEMEQLYQQVGHFVRFGPNAFKFTKDPGSKSVLLENLCPQGFKNADRLQGLDMAHTECALKKLAQFHAASAHRIAVKGAYPKEVSDFKMDDAGAMAFSQILNTFGDTFLSELKNFKDGEKYYDNVQRLTPTIFSYYLQQLDPESKGFKVLLHGDCWSNNILFNYDKEGRPLEACFVDYQVTRYGSPVEDLHYFLMTSTALDIKTRQFDYFIRFYHEHLVEHLQILSYPHQIPSLRQLHLDVYKFGTSAYVATVVTLPIVLLDPTDKANFSNFMSADDSGKDFKKMIFSNKRYISHMEEILPWLHNRGFLEPYESAITTEPATLSAPSTVSTESAVEIVVEDGLTIPDWLTPDCFLNILNENKDFKQMKKFTVTKATSAGDNYASTLLKVDVEVLLRTGGKEQHSFMLKIAPKGDQANAMLDIFQTFPRETLMYKDTIPEFERLYREAGHEVVFGPKHYTFSKHPGCDVILMENLRPKGFKNADRLAGLDMKHTEAILKKLAQFHAVSACVYEVRGEYDKKLHRSIYVEEMRPMMETVGKSLFDILFDSMKTFKGHEEYLDKLTRAKDIFFDVMLKASQVDDNDFNVLNHGDCWTNNVMFEHDAEGHITNCYFVDFQMSRYCSPVQDLYYFLLSSPALDIKLSQFDHFIRYYHDNLEEHLKILKYPKPIPTLKQLQLDLFKYGAWGFSIVTGVMAAVLLDPTESANLEAMFGEDDAGMSFKRMMYTNKRYRQHAEAIMLWLDRRGLLDYELEAPPPPLPQVPAPVSTAEHTPVNETQLTEVLSKNIPEFSRVARFEVKERVTQKGDCTTELVTINVDVVLKDNATKQLCYVLKKRKDFNERELQVHTEYLPDFEKIYLDAGHLNLTFAPKHYVMEDGTVLVENLEAHVFKRADRVTGLDIAHTECVIRKLAQLHAASIKRIALKGGFPTSFHVGVVNQETCEFFKKDSDAIVSACKGFQDKEEYVHKLEELMESAADRALQFNNVDPLEFNVLNHGECWLDNIWFHYDAEGKIKDTCFSNFQDAKYAPPAYDLYMLLISSPQTNVTTAQFDYFVRLYHESLMENLILLKYDGKTPTLKEIHASLFKYGFLAFHALFGVTLLRHVQLQEHDLSLNVLCANNSKSAEQRKQIYANGKFKEYAETLLAWCSKRGLLDC